MDRVTELFGRMKGWVSVPTPRQRAIVGNLFQAMVLIASILYLAANLRVLSMDALLENLRLEYIVLSWLGTLAAFWLGALGWWLLLCSLQGQIDLRMALFAHLISNMTKYVPGYVWQFLSKAHLTHKMEIPKRVIGVAILGELVLVTSIGMVTGAIVVSVYPLDIALFLRHFMLIGGLAAAIGIVLLPLLWKYIAVFLELEISLRIRAYWYAVLVIWVGWLCFGISFWFLGASLVPAEFSTWPIFLFSIVASSLLSLLIPLLPGGLGVRESALTFLLSPFLGTGVSALIATLSRVTWFLSEAAAAGLVYIGVRGGHYRK